MSNLGWYQAITTMSKKVGGPKNLLLITAGGGYLLGKTGEAIVKKIYKTAKKQSKDNEIIRLYEVTSDGTNGKDLELNMGDKYRVLASDNESVLIEKIGDSNNPYFVSIDFLRLVSDFNE